ncbi:hypothetical protein [Microbispora sp. NPDC049125]|uniref:hypothetical protein n=1 Tax=Microbispora sp. NPDC049125 TaxID=3154929 RepID=UPI003467CDB3
MSKRVIVTLASATVLSAVVPGLAGYVTAQFEALDHARHELARLQAQLRMLELTVEPAGATSCQSGRSADRQPGLPGLLDGDGREPTIPPRTHTRPWHNSAYVRVLAPTLWTSVVTPTTLPRPAPSDFHHHHHHHHR